MNDVVKALNPYEELGLLDHRDADEITIKAAYRKAAKTAHPDAGGSAEWWGRIQRSYDVLMDPALRKTYDDTGRVEEDRPDNDRAAALQVIEMHFGTILNEYLLGNHAPHLDPRKRDVVKAIEGRILAEVDQAEQAIAQGSKVLVFFRDMLDRFIPKEGAGAGDNFFATQMNTQIGMAEQQVAGLEANIRVRNVALEIVRGYDFRYDQPAPDFDAAADAYHNGTRTAYSWPGGSD